MEGSGSEPAGWLGWGRPKIPESGFWLSRTATRSPGSKFLSIFTSQSGQNSRSHSTAGAGLTALQTRWELCLSPSSAQSPLAPTSCTLGQTCCYKDYSKYCSWAKQVK